MREHQQHTKAVMVRHGVAEKTVNFRRTTSVVEGRSMVFHKHTLHDEVRNLRLALSDLKIQVSDLVTASGRE